ncbi:helix-turn-helix domain-containing protein [Sphingobacterium spiritivorum]|uniref:helix-turn-helix domain-containing protein n=1 Tax=Sphingobacterium spiritivorum TaxID=258 RepID=UPI003DA3E89F
MINIISTFHAFSAGALWLLGTLIILGVNRTNAQADRWLGAFFYLTACLFTQLFLESFHVDSEALLHLLELPRWTILPCLYMAIHYMVRPTAAVKFWGVHFIPFAAFLFLSTIYLIPGFFNVGIHPPQLPRWIVLVIKYFFYVQCVFYWISCYRLLKMHSQNIQQLSSYTEKINMIWLKYLLIAVLFLMVIRLLAISHPNLNSIAPLLYFTGSIALAYATLTQRSIYSLESAANIVDKIGNKNKAGERLTSQQVDILKNVLLQKTTTQRLHLNPGLTLSTLADHIGINTHDLSYVINNGLEKNFYQFINELRTEEAKKLLVSGEAKQLDMFGIAIQAGFNSRTTFYSSFKKVTGVTPTEYIKAYHSRSSS